MHKRDFGSFHSSNVQELLTLSDEAYIAPGYPVDISLPETLKTDFSFGKDARQKYFLLEDQCIFLNHGAFGGVLKVALEKAQEWQYYAERQPLRFYDRELLPLLADVTRRLARFIKCSPLDLVLTTNATTAINSVIRSFKFHSDDVILILNVTYGAVKKLLKQISIETNITIKEVEITFPIKENQQIIDQIEKELSDRNIKLAVFDHIPSNAPFILPIKQITQLCHKRNIPVLVDGAHTLGNIPLDVENLEADFYVSNCHKWFCCPKGAAFLYVTPQYQSSIRPLVVSHGYGSGFNSEFVWTGLHDYSAFLSLCTVIEFWESIGVGSILQNNHSLAITAGKLLSEKWKTQLMAPDNMFGSMALIELPRFNKKESDTVTYQDAETVQNKLYYKYNIEVPIKVISNRLCVRISAHVYNTLEEYEKLTDAVLELSQLQ